MLKAFYDIVVFKFFLSELFKKMRIWVDFLVLKRTNIYNIVFT